MTALQVVPDADAIVLDLYCRISKDYDGTLRSVEDQEAQGRQWIKDHAHLGYVLGVVHRDHALSAWKPGVKRPEFNALMARLESGQAHGVWVRNLDRFARKVKEGERLLDVAEHRGTRVLASDGDYDLTTARGQLQFRDTMARAEFESKQISERTRRGFKNKALRGKSNASTRGFGRPGFAPVPEGWEPGDPRELVPAEQVARERGLVQDAAARILAGEYLNAIAVEWNEAGVTTTRGGLWDGGIIRQMLSKPSLCGLATHKGEVVGTLQDVDPVLDRETWDRLQLHFAASTRGRPATEYLLSGIVRCGLCGHTLYGRPSGGGRKLRADGSVRRQYWCQTRPNQPDRCGRIRIDQRLVDGFVEKIVLERLTDPANADRVARRAAHLEEARNVIRQQLAKCEADADALVGKTATWGFARVEKAMEPLNAMIQDLRDQLGEVEADADTALDVGVEWADATLTQRRAMVRRAFPEGLYVGPATTTGRAAAAETPRRVLLGPPVGVTPKGGVKVRQNGAQDR